MKTEENPFISLPKHYRIAILGYVAIYFFLVPLLKLFFADIDTPHTVSRQMLSFIYYFLLFFPLIFYRSRYGLLHPLIFPLLFMIFSRLLESPMHLFGFTSPLFNEIYNDALPRWNQWDLAYTDFKIRILNILALICYYLGYFYGPALKNFKLKQGAYVPKYFLLTCIFFIAASLSVLFLYLSSKGGLTAHFDSFGDGRSDIRQSDGIILVLVKFAFVGAFLMYAFNKNIITKLPYLLLMVPILFVTFLGEGSRSSIIFYAALIILLWIVHKRQLPTFRVIIFGVLAIVVIGVLGNLRNSTQSTTNQVDWSILTNFTFEEAITAYNQDLENRRERKNPSLPVMARAIEEHGMLWGKSYLAAVFFWFPRIIWEDKPHGIGYYTARLLFGDEAGRSGTAVDEAYWNFHIPGIILIFFLYGIFHKSLANFYISNSSTPSGKAIFIILLFLMEAPGTMSVLATVQVLIPALFIMWISGVFSPKRIVYAKT